MFEELKAKLNNMKIDEPAIWLEAANDPEVKQLVIDLNTKNQLGDEGIDSLSRSLGEYAPFTVNERSRKGLQTDHVDFKVTGDYWGSWNVSATKDAIIIDTDDARFEELVIELRFAPEHVGLTEDSKQKVSILLAEKYNTIMRRKLQAA